MKHRVLLLLLMLMCVLPMSAFAFTEPDTQPDLQPYSDRLSVTTAWTAGEMLYIEVHDTETGAVSAIELRLSDYAENCETITIQAVDFNGNKSGVIQIVNPYYKPDSSDSSPSSPPAADIAGGGTPLTPDGTGAVVDNVTEKEGKEFFTITTENGNDFYLIVDRQKTGENVYLLNAVTEDDLMALSKKGSGSTSVIPTPSPTPVPTPTPPPEPIPEPAPPATNNSVSYTQYLIIGVAVIVAGGAAYYLKIYKPKQQSADESEEDDIGEIEVEDDTV